MQSLNNLYQYLLKTYPLRYQEKWDQCGLKIFGDKNINIDQVLITLDINRACINFAIDHKIKLIIAHHPIFTDDENFESFINDKQNIKLLKKHKINTIGFHTNIDNHPYGLNHYLVHKLPIKNAVQKLTKAGSYFVVNLKQSYEPKQLAKLFKDTFDVNVVQSLDFKHKINQLYFCSGSAFSILKPTLKNIKTNMAIVTGDIKWHNWQILNDLQASAFDIGHDVEKWFIELLTKKILAFDSTIKVFSFYPDLKIDIYK